jgi:D-alanyl-lipoteichoic acid acyltransferase DltB (MBOAT superfamily)
MLFTSYAFIGFLAVALIAYYAVPKKLQWMLLLVASFMFYWIANPKYLLFIGITTITVYFAARVIEKNIDRQTEYLKQHKEELSKDEKKEYKKLQKKIRFRWVAFFVFLNIGILLVVKYTNFFLSMFAPIVSLFSGREEIQAVSLLVPMGISFYTFQAVGYLVDVYRGTIRAEKNLFKFSSYL